MTHPLVLLHALSLTSAMWTRQRLALLRSGHRVLAPDLCGHGTAPPGTAVPSLDVAADELARTLDRLGIGRVALAGSSMGGYVAMAFLRRHPGRVHALALLGVRAGADDPATAAGRAAFADAILDPASRDRLVAGTVPKLVGATTRAARPEVLAEIRGMVGSVSPEAIAWSQRAIAVRPDSFEVLRTAAVPSVVIAGAEDELVPVDEAHRMVAALPRGRLVTVAGAGHLTPLEAPDLVAAALTELVAQAGTGIGSRAC